ncbi:PhzF family phenazine biosynthesis protein [Thermostichus sp. MS-CIW-19]|uniref:PhzF family phenazine biosynthesis protein n=1 Tax=unclassified Synechococcus TaxID=2626047 RepID=UPI0002F7A59A|nr:PhzF family phenazine biosynthesis protein [Synechococcus sp. 65AY6Li]PIK85130.1 phenazine biosynthesis protein PhzF [Synechococcus sp. 63AY4M2]PIK88380.1 phenazine biosynthesis protein PhzF [Synechococcus sp. 65AY6A5]PIK94170.1 phenazine biosynthesis protein PhzF [Synechococcus sp. 60AY4M2]PIK98753.1 phenazine biosynthesis protein PhzF [Synechococcus sp. 63AY4M1]PIL00513.1 phenazine biosynthesis protein PhzF [Synechococcus sp. 65AY640]
MGKQVRIPLFQVDAFTAVPFKGNPAAVCLLPQELPAALMRAIAAENNLSETAFLLPQGSEGEVPHYGLRWFTPTTEVELCGHATLGSAYVLLTEIHPEAQGVAFSTRSGRLQVRRQGERLAMDFPAQFPQPWPEGQEQVAAALGIPPLELYRGSMGVAVLTSAQQVQQLQPDWERVQALPVSGLIVTASGGDLEDQPDFVCRVFAPQLGIPEDPVTGSAQCLLTPYWSQRLGRTELKARQLSARGGELWCRDLGTRVEIAGQAVLVIAGELRIP